jgi:hypothetical protein
MKKLSLIILLLICSHLLFAQWDELGGAGSVRFAGKHFSGMYAMAADDSGNIFIGGSFSTVWKYNNALKTWGELGSAASGGTPLNITNVIDKLCTDRAGNVYALCYTGDYNDLYRWKKATNAWSKLDSLMSGTTDIKADKAGNIYVNGLDSVTRVQFIKKWDGSSWSKFGPDLYDMYSPYVMLGEMGGIALNDSGHVYASKGGYILKNNGTAWVDTFYTGILSTIRIMTCDPDGNLYFAMDWRGPIHQLVYKLDAKTRKVDLLCRKVPTFATHSETQVLAMATVSSTELYVSGHVIVNEAPYMPVAKWDKLTDSWYKVGQDTDVINGANGSCMLIDTFNKKGKLLVGGMLYNTVIGGFGDQFVAEYTPPCNAYFTLSPTSVAHTYTLTDYCTGTGKLNYLWTWGDGKVDTGTTPTHIYDSAGIYQICVAMTDSLGCTSSFCMPANSHLAKTTADMVYVNVVRSKPTHIADQATPGNTFSVYPNPTATSCMAIGKCANREAHILVKDLSGKVLLEEKVAVRDGSFRQSISLDNIASGMYFIELQTSTGSNTLKLFKN